MELIVHKDFNEIYEISGLIRFTLYPDQIEKMFSDEDGSNLLGEHIEIKEIHEKYVKTFSDNFVSSTDNFFFFEEEDLDISISLNLYLALNKDWLNNIEMINEDELRRKFYEPMHMQSLADLVATFERSLEEGVEVENHAFKHILLYQKPKKYLSRFIKIINNNLPAYRKARQAIEVDVASRLADFKEPPKAYFEKFPELRDLDFPSPNNRNEFYPSLVKPFGIEGVGVATSVFSGLYFNENFERLQRQEKPKNVLAEMFKMLGEENKLRILMMLREETMYNLQIANELGISSAATHNHMAALLNQGFVSVESRGGKVYYTLEKKQFYETIANIEAVFL